MAKDTFPSKRHAFKKGQSGNPKGRPKKMFNHIKSLLEDAGVEALAKDDYEDALQRMPSMTMLQLKEIAGNPNPNDPNNDDETNDWPILYRVIARELMGKNRQKMLSEIADRVFGKATQKVEVKGKTVHTVSFKQTFPGKAANASAE